MKKHFVTGATGFVGGALVLELLRSTDAVVYCGVRADSDAHARARLHACLFEAAQAYGWAGLIPEIERRCMGLAFDLRTESAPRADLGRGATVWHAAASLRFEEERAAEIIEDNVAGTARVLSFAKAIGARRMNYVSTAYVAGPRSGTIVERPVATDAVCNNWYERSKIDAEALVLAATGLETRVLRPSIVIGHSRTYAASSTTGIYGFMRGTLQFREVVADQLGSMLAHRALSVVADPALRLNLVPVDRVAFDAVVVGMADTRERIFHLSDEQGVALGPFWSTFFQRVGLALPRFTTHRDAFTSIDEAFDDGLAFYASYMQKDKMFDRSHTNAVVGPSTFPTLTLEEAMKYVEWYLGALGFFSNEASASRSA